MPIEKLQLARKVVIYGFFLTWILGLILHAIYGFIGWIGWDTVLESSLGLTALFSPAIGLIVGYYVSKRTKYNRHLALVSVIIIVVALMVILLIFLEEYLLVIPIDSFYQKIDKTAKILLILPSAGIGYLFTDHEEN